MAELSSSEIEVYPNPVKDRCTITAEIDDWSKYDIQLVNLQGQTLYNKLHVTNTAKSSASCEFNTVVSGIYYLQVNSKVDVRISYRHAVMIVGEAE